MSMDGNEEEIFFEPSKRLAQVFYLILSPCEAKLGESVKNEHRRCVANCIKYNLRICLCS